MKVLDLQCSQGHAFEGWFASHDDYESQRERGLLSCPLCNDAQVTRTPSAPRLNLGHGQSEPPPAPAGAAAVPVAGQTPALPPPAALQAAWMKMVRHVMANTEDVGQRFAEEARRMHHGESEGRGIRGQASREETEALLDEGVEILPLPVPVGLKEPLQ